MNLDNILKRRALRLKSELTEGDRPKPSFLSVIYPAMDHGDNAPPEVKTPSSIPGAEAGEAADLAPEKGEKEKDEPGPSKAPDTMKVGISAPDAHKRAAFELGYFGENRSEQFIKRCVELITGVKRVEQEDPTEGEDVDVADGGSCACGSQCDKCKPAATNEDDSERSKLSAVAKKFTKTKPSYG